jgi:hypothetical protein
MRRFLKFGRYLHISELFYTVALVFVFSYIAFDLLDLDLSNFHLTDMQRNSAAIMTAAPEAAELAKTVKATSFRLQPLVVPASRINESIRIQLKQIPRALRFRGARFLFRPRFIPASTKHSSPAA